MKDVTLNTIKITHGKPEFVPWAVETSIMVNDTTAQVDLIDVEDEERK
jgi:laminin, alpha 3/5